MLWMKQSGEQADLGPPENEVITGRISCVKKYDGRQFWRPSNLVLFAGSGWGVLFRGGFCSGGGFDVGGLFYGGRILLSFSGGPGRGGNTRGGLGRDGPNQAFGTGADQILPVGGQQCFTHEVIIPGIPILNQSPLHCLFMGICWNIYFFHGSGV